MTTARHPLENLAGAVRQLRYATRRLARSRGYALATCVNVVLGAGVTAAMFVVLNDVVLAPLPYPDSGRLVIIEHEMPGIPMAGEPTRFGAFQGLAELYGQRSDQIEAIGVFGAFDAAISDDSDPEYVRIGYASHGFFAALGVQPAAGRLPREPGTPGPEERLTILSHEIWRTRYAADPQVVGAFLQVEGFEREITGVMPPGETFPREPVAVWSPRPAATVRDNPEWLVDGLLARLRGDATVDSVREELDRLVAELPDRSADEFVERAVQEGRLRARVTLLQDHVVGGVSRALWLLFGGALLVFVAALFNVTNLAIVHGQAQAVEVAVRAALGASAVHLRRHRMAEAFLLALAAGAASYATAWTAIAVLRRLAPTALPRLDEVAVGSEAAAIIGLLSLLVAAWITLVTSVGPSGAASLRPTQVGAAVGRGSRLLRDGLAAAQLGVAVVLLVSAGLLLRSFAALAGVHPGFDPSNAVTFRVPFPFQEIQAVGAAGGAATPFYDELAERIRQIPGVVAAGYGKCAPFSDTCGIDGLTLDRGDAEIDTGSAGSLVGIAQIAPGYLDALGVPLLRGRGLQRRDHLERTNAVLLSASLAGRLFGADDPLGKTLVTRDLPGWTPFTVVGIVADARHSDLRAAAEPMAYIPVLAREQQFELWTTSFVVRGETDPAALVASVRAIVRQMRPDIPLARVETMALRMRRATSGMRLGTLLLAVTSAATLLLGALGVYGVIAYSVALRRGEFGVRMAVGATGGNLRALVVRHAVVLTTVGSLAGVVAALLGSRLLGTVLYGVPPTDPMTYTSVVVLLASVSLAAALLPANRAARTDPGVVLRAG